MTIADIFDRYVALASPRRRRQRLAHIPLEDIAMVALDCETTGLDPRRDRVVSIAALPIARGLVVAATPALDVIVDPRIPIPPRAVSVHGIDDARVAGCPTIADVWDEVETTLANRVVVGHHVGFDLSVLAHEARRTGRPWQEPVHLDTAAMLGGLGISASRHDLADVLPRLGIGVRGARHTALGDATMTADLFVELARRLRGQGRGTFGGAIAAHRAPRT